MSSKTAEFATHVREFSQLLILLRAQLGNDLDMVLILAVIAERHYAAIQAAGIADPQRGASRDRDAARINALSVSLYTEIPRETVRRKIAMLVDKGWVACDARGNLSPTAQAASELAKGTAATLDYLGAVGQAR